MHLISKFKQFSLNLILECQLWNGILSFIIQQLWLSESLRQLWILFISFFILLLLMQELFSQLLNLFISFIILLFWIFKLRRFLWNYFISFIILFFWIFKFLLQSFNVSSFLFDDFLYFFTKLMLMDTMK